MAIKLPAITIKDLQALLSCIGSATSGTKSALEDRLARALQPLGSAPGCPVWRARPLQERRKPLRIVSIDMGIKNLAYCEVEVSRPSEKSPDAVMKIVRWEKIDLVNTSREHQSHLPNPRDCKKSAANSDDDVDPYSLSVLSGTAYKLIRNTILAGEPDVILIEKQRWRSGGGSAIQQWTVRVNTLEGMLWAVLETLRSERHAVLPKLGDSEAKKNYEVFGVDPKRVGHYWLEQEARLVSMNKDEENKSSRKNMEKKAKIKLLRSWLGAIPMSVNSSKTAPKITFEMSASAESIRQALCLPSTTAKKTKKAKSSDHDVEGDALNIERASINKLDDITDCFLQAAAWVSWDQYWTKLLEIKTRKRKDDGRRTKLDHEVLLEMLEEIEGR